jgi:hypothetical protein
LVPWCWRLTGATLNQRKAKKIMTNFDAEEFMEGRIAAGREIDVETCKLIGIHGNAMDPYGIYPNGPDSYVAYEKLLFVDGPDSDGWVYEEDLPEDKRHALRDRIDRANRIPSTAEDVRSILLEEYARAAAWLDVVIDDVVEARFSKVPADTVRVGVRLALSDLGKQDQVERLERKLRATDAQKQVIGEQ